MHRAIFFNGIQILKLVTFFRPTEHKEPHKEHLDHHHHDLQHPEPQHSQDHDEDRLVHVHPPHPWLSLIHI